MVQRPKVRMTPNSRQTKCLNEISPWGVLHAFAYRYRSVRALDSRIYGFPCRRRPDPSASGLCRDLDHLASGGRKTRNSLTSRCRCLKLCITMDGLLAIHVFYVLTRRIFLRYVQAISYWA